MEDHDGTRIPLIKWQMTLQSLKICIAKLVNHGTD